jgi:very-short-patch-repair endonuclease
MTSGVILLQRVKKDKLSRARQLRLSPTPAEMKLWQHLRRNQIACVKFRRQQLIEGFIVDFFCHKAGLVIEIDGAYL